MRGLPPSLPSGWDFFQGGIFTIDITLGPVLGEPHTDQKGLSCSSQDSDGSGGFLKMLDTLGFETALESILQDP